MTPLEPTARELAVPGDQCCGAGFSAFPSTGAASLMSGVGAGGGAGAVPLGREPDLGRELRREERREERLAEHRADLREELRETRARERETREREHELRREERRGERWGDPRFWPTEREERLFARYSEPPQERYSARRYIRSQSGYALTGSRYPIFNRRRAWQSLERVKRYGSSAEIEKVRYEVKRRYPDMEREI